MINVNDPLIKRFVDNLHKAVERKSKNLSSSSYDDYIRENRIIKIFCEDKTRGPHQCAAEMNARYQTKLDNEDIIRVLKANRLSYQDKRARASELGGGDGRSFHQSTRNAKEDGLR